MVSVALLIFAGVLGGLSLVALGRLARESTVDGRALGEQVARLLHADERPRAVELCAAAPHTAAGAFLLFMLSLELPRRLIDPVTPGYRGEPRTVAFDVALRRLVSGEEARRGHRYRTHAFTVIVASCLAAALSGAALLSPAPQRLAFVVVSATATLLIVLALWRLERCLEALGAAHGILLPRLRPIEEMSAADLRAATRARALVGTESVS